MSPPRQLPAQQLIRRLFMALLFACLLTASVSAWIFHSANEQAADALRTSAHDHYINTIADFNQRSGREAFNFKVHLESLHFLENIRQYNDQLQSHFTSLGGSLEFPSLRIEDARGNLIAAYEYGEHKVDKARFRPGQDMTWVFDPSHARLYMAFRQPIWLGHENGQLILFKPMDNALLNQLNYPYTRLSLWWNDQPIASSDGSDGLRAVQAAYRQTGGENLGVLLRWSGADSDDAPFLAVESTAPPLLDARELVLPLLLSLITFAAAIWAVLGKWGMRALKQLLFEKTASSVATKTPSDNEIT